MVIGHTWVQIKISDLAQKKSKKVKALVNTGASLTTLPEEVAEEVGTEPVDEERVSTGAGEIKVKRGRAWIELEDKEDAFPVWISDFIDKVLLGVVVLESFGFEVDPKTGKLKKKPLLLYRLGVEKDWGFIGKFRHAQQSDWPIFPSYA